MLRLKYVFCFTVLAVITVAFCSCSPKATVFSKDGMEITLTEEFTEGKYYDMTAYYDSENATVSAFKEEFTLLEENGESSDMTLNEYAEILMKSGEVNAEVKTEDGLTYFEYEKTIDYEVYSVTYIYYSVVYKSSDSFWLFQFACEKELYSEYSEQFEIWAKSVNFE